MPATSREQAVKELTAIITEELPIRLTPEEETKIQDRAYDFVGMILDAVGETYHVVSKH